MPENLDRFSQMVSSRPELFLGVEVEVISPEVPMQIMLKVPRCVKMDIFFGEWSKAINRKPDKITEQIVVEPRIEEKNVVKIGWWQQLRNVLSVPKLKKVLFG